MYFPVMDTLVTQLGERCDNLCHTVSYFHCLDQEQISKDNKDSLKRFYNIYRNDSNTEKAIVEYDH